MRPMMAALLHPELPARRSVPQNQFDAARVLRSAGWSHFRIARTLGISLSQVRVAVDRKAQAASERWSA